MRRRLGGLPLAAYVVTLLLIPMAAVAVFSIREVRDNNRTAAAADRVAQAIDVELAAISVLPALEIERISLVGTARLDELGVSPAVAAEVTGLDLVELRDEREGELDVALERLYAAIDEDPGPSGDRLANVLRAEQIGLSMQRSLVEVGAADSAEIDETVARIESLLGKLVFDANAAASSVQAGTLETAGIIDQLAAVTNVIRTAAAETGMLGNAIIDEESVAMDAMMASSFRHEDALRAALNAEDVDVDVLVRVYEGLGAPPEGLYDGTLETGSALLAEPDALAALAGLLIERIEYLDRVADFATEEGTAISERADELAAAAEWRNRVTVLALVIVFLGSLLFGIVVIRSFARPLQELRSEAERISDGALDARTLPLVGPSDIRQVTEAMNEMAGTLRSVDAHMKVLATGETDDDEHLDDLPGAVGASMRHSVERVTELTAELQLSRLLLEQQARHDPLTGLPNRFAVLEHLGDALASAGSEPDVGVMFVDIDGFKSVNDTHGHAVGDLVLTEVAERLRRSIRDGDMVARLGGDEFLVVVDECADRAGLESFGERMIREIEQPYTIGEQFFAVSASVGVTSLEAADDAMAAIARADAAVYHAKRRGRRRVEMFDADLQTSIEHTAELELALRRAIHEDELRVHLQPLVDIKTGRVTSVEALVRWERPGVGLVPPAEFVPIAERSGLIFDLERWVLDRACGRIAAWRKEHPESDVRIAVNISGRHLIEGELLRDLEASIDRTGADPTMIEIELTESHLLDDVDRASGLLHAIRARGVRIAIDDFGTGYSSMTYLQKLPLDIVKIDKSFISRATDNGFDSTIVEAVVTIGRTLALDVVAEGVETMEQLEYVRERGVTRAQGFLLAHPVPADDAEAIVFGGPVIDVDGTVMAAGVAGGAAS